MRRIFSAALAASFMMTSLAASAATPTPPGVSNAVETHIKRGAPRTEDLDEIQKYVASHPDDLHGRFLLGELLACGGFEDLAREQFDVVSKTDPNYVLNQLHDLMRNNSWEAARWLGSYAQEKYPNDSGLMFMIGRQWLSKGKKTKANEWFEKAMQHPPVWPGTYQALAALRFAQSRRDQAIQFADQAIALDPSDEGAVALKVASQAELSGHPERYLSQLEKAAPRHWMNDALSTELAQAYLNKQEWAKALEPALFGLEYSSGSRLELATQQVKILMGKLPSGDMIAALNRLSPLRAQDFQSTVLRMRFAKCLSDIGAHKQATKMLLEALQMHAYFAPAINWRLGKEMEAQHRDEDAIFFFKSAHDLRPEDQDYTNSYERAKMRYSNTMRYGDGSNDLARKLKRALNKKPRS